MRRISNELLIIQDFPRRDRMEFKEIVTVWLGNTLFVYLHHSFAEIDRWIRRWIRCRGNQGSVHILERDGVADPNLHARNLFQLQILGQPCRFSPSRLASSGGYLGSARGIQEFLHGDYIVQSRHPCKDPANEKLPGFSLQCAHIAGQDYAVRTHSWARTLSGP